MSKDNKNLENKTIELCQNCGEPIDSIFPLTGRNKNEVNYSKILDYDMIHFFPLKGTKYTLF